jgi:hypothetical protein
MHDVVAHSHRFPHHSTTSPSPRWKEVATRQRGRARGRKVVTVTVFVLMYVNSLGARSNLESPPVKNVFSLVIGKALPHASDSLVIQTVVRPCRRNPLVNDAIISEHVANLRVTMHGKMTSKYRFG